jgi:8-amino-7-oxononanoate synthase
MSSFLSRNQLTAYWLNGSKSLGIYPYFRAISASRGSEVKVDGRWLIMVGSNDYLGLSQDVRVQEAVVQAMQRFGTANGGSRFLCGNLTLHEELEERLADFVGKRHALVHSTGFSTNTGIIQALLEAGDRVLCDKENHASLFEGCRAARARVVPFQHNSSENADSRIARVLKEDQDKAVFLVTEGVFSMSGDISPLDKMVALKKKYPALQIYVDDAHGLGVVGPGGAGTCAHFGATKETDFIMGTFSKAFASVGGFVAGDDEEVMSLLQHTSQSLIFSAALPPANVAAVLACLDIIRQEPERLAKLKELTKRAHRGYREIGLLSGEPNTPIMPIMVGDEQKAAELAADLFKRGVFALPAVYPAVAKGKAVIRTAFSAVHTEDQVDRVLEILSQCAAKYKITISDFEDNSEGLDAVGRN